MLGHILTFDEMNNTGQISGYDGVRYKFTRIDIKDAKLVSLSEAKMIGIEVDFVKSKGNKAKEIVKSVQVKKDTNQNVNIVQTGGISRYHKSRGVAIVLALVFGTIGLHKFYLGEYLLGFLYICFAFSGIPTILGLMEAVCYAFNTQQYFDNKYNNTNIGLSGITITNN